jgi:hypothetical protein
MNDEQFIVGLKSMAANEAQFNLMLKERGICIQCEKPALPRCHSPLGRKEFEISGMCEICFDSMFKDEPKIDTGQQLVKDLIDQAFKQEREMIRTHSRDAIIAFIETAKELEVIGYTMVWDKSHKLVGAKKTSRGGDNNAK